MYSPVLLNYLKRLNLSIYPRQDSNTAVCRIGFIIPAASLAPKATANDGYQPSHRENRAVVRNISIKNCIPIHRIVRIIYAFFERFGLKKKRPYTNPDKNSIRVICGMMGPDGARRQLSKSPVAAVRPEKIGPYMAPVIKTDINLRGIFTTVPILNVQKIDRRAVIATSNPNVQISLTDKCGKNFFIKKSPFL